jgi:hypothetical protein
MAISADALRAALADLPATEDDAFARGRRVGARVYRFMQENRAGSAMAEIAEHGQWIHFAVAGGDPRHWEIECLSPDEFRLYPGFESGGQVTWANVWVRESNLTVDELVDQVNDVAFRKDEFANA